MGKAGYCYLMERAAGKFIRGIIDVPLIGGLLIAMKKDKAQVVAKLGTVSFDMGYIAG